MTPDEIARIEMEVKQVVHDLYRSVAEGEVALWMATINERTGPWALGMEVGDFRETAEGFEAHWTSDDETRVVRQEMDGLEIRAFAITPTVAYATVTSPDRRWYKANGEVDRNASAETWVFVLAEGGWKLFSGQSALFPI